MKKWLKRIGIGIGVLVLALAIVVFDFLRHGGQFRDIEPHFAGACDTLELDASAEDIEIDQERGMAYLSWLDRRGLIEGKPVTGTVKRLDLHADEPEALPALTGEPPGFRPHGMSLYVPAQGPRVLFVISHPQGAGHEVAIFEETITGAFALATIIRDPLLVEPNAIVATGPRKFYVANDSGASNGFERGLELLFRIGMSSVVLYDGHSMRTVAEGLKSPAGITISPDYTRVYVGETSGKSMRIYSRDVINGDLEEIGHVDVGSATDNLKADTDGNIWIGAHAKVLALVRQFGDAAALAPTQILRWSGSAPEGEQLEEIFLDDGSRISAGSVGAVWRDKLLIGSVTAPRVLVCTLPGS